MVFNTQIPECWEKVNLGDVLRYIGNGLTDKQNKFGIGYPVTRIETISDDCIDADKVGHVDALTTDKIKKYRLRLGDILVSHINSEPQLGRAVIYDGNPEFLLHGMNLLRMQADKQKLDPFFLNLIFRFYRDHGVFIALASRSVGQASINQSRMKSLVIPLPPLPEQRSIAHILHTIQEAKFTRKHKMALERERKAALMDFLFTHGTKGEPRKQTEIGEIPESWEIVRFEDVCTFTTGKLNSEQAVADGQYPFFTCSQETFKIDSYSFDQKAILLSGNNAKGIFSVKYYKGKFDAYQRTYIITINDTEELSYRYLLYELFLKLELLRKQSIGATTKYLTASIIRNLELTIPPLPEQRAIANIFRGIDDKIAALEREVELIDELFHAMLEELMTGKRSAVPLIGTELRS